jgi:ketosteroid isomerase-like protein
MRKFLLALAVACLVLTAWCFHRRLFQDDEKRVAAVIEEMRQAAEKKSADGLIGHFSNDYSDRDGNTKFMIYGMVKGVLDRVDEIRIKVSDVKVTVAGDRAWASARIVAEATRDGQVYYPFGSDSDPETPSLTFKKTKTGDWAVVKVENVRNSSF